MKVLIVGGFLGSGKTTLIRQIAEYLVNREKKRIIIIENELGEVGIDDKFLTMEGFQVTELFSGCICCQLTGELTLAVNRIKEEFHPDWIIIEATGVAKPGPIIKTLREYTTGMDGLSTVILADAGRWRELLEVLPGLINSQVAEADHVVLNKIDEAGQEDLKSAVAGIKEINPSAAVYAVSALNILDDAFLGGLCGSA